MHVATQNGLAPVYGDGRDGFNRGSRQWETVFGPTPIS